MGSNLRVITLNFWGTEPPLAERIDLALVQLRELAPDVVCLQEVRPHADGLAGPTTAHLLAEALGMQCAYGVAVRWEAGAHGLHARAGQEGLAILARSIGETRELALPEARPAEARMLLSAQVATDGGPIWIHTTHLHYRLDDGVAREQQVLAIDAAIRAQRTNESPPQILCGDFNATPDSDEIRFLRGLTTLGGRRTHFQDAWLKHHPEPAIDATPEQGLTWSSENDLTRPLRSLDLDRRIDYVFVTSRKKDGRGTVHDARVVLTERRDVDGHGSICASDHYGVLADVQVVAG